MARINAACTLESIRLLLLDSGDEEDDIVAAAANVAAADAAADGDIGAPDDCCICNHVLNLSNIGLDELLSSSSSSSLMMMTSLFSPGRVRGRRAGIDDDGDADKDAASLDESVWPVAAITIEATSLRAIAAAVR